MIINIYEDIAQSVRALACHARGRGGGTRYSRHFFIHNLILIFLINKIILYLF
jgi:hypothetical protein